MFHAMVEPVTIAILDHRSNPGYPTHWHARGYGLFAANPLGQKTLNDGTVEITLPLEPGVRAENTIAIGSGDDAKRRIQAVPP